MFQDSQVLNGMDSVLRAKDANQILFAVLPLEYNASFRYIV